MIFERKKHNQRRPAEFELVPQRRHARPDEVGDHLSPVVVGVVLDRP